MSAGSTSYLEISPSNITSNTRVSYNNGQPVITFTIGSQERLLIPNSVRICGNIACYKSSSGDRGVIPLTTEVLNVNPKLGAMAFVDQIVLSSQKHKNVIEHVRHWGRFMCSYLPNVTSKQEALGHLDNTGNTMPNFQGEKLAFVNNVNGSLGTDDIAFEGNAFCFPLTCGFLTSSQPVGLSERGWGISGLSIDVHLTPDSQFFNNGQTFTDAFYQLTNLKLIAEVINPSMDELSSLMSRTSGAIEYNAISSYYQTIQSTNAIINFRLGLSRVLGISMNFIPSTYLNNLQYDGFATLPLIDDLSAGTIAQIEQVIFLRGGEKLPLDFDINTNVRDNSDLVVADPMLVREFMNSFQPFMKGMKSQLNPTTNNRIGFDNVEQHAEGGPMIGVGVQFDNISGEGVNFQTESFGLQMITALTSALAQSVFLFVRSKQTCVYNINGVQVVQ